jgi:hypothetical protein
MLRCHVHACRAVQGHRTSFPAARTAGCACGAPGTGSASRRATRRVPNTHTHGKHTRRASPGQAQAAAGAEGTAERRKCTSSHATSCMQLARPALCLIVTRQAYSLCGPFSWASVCRTLVWTQPAFVPLTLHRCSRATRPASTIWRCTEAARRRSPWPGAAWLTMHGRFCLSLHA